MKFKENILKRNVMIAFGMYKNLSEKIDRIISKIRDFSKDEMEYFIRNFRVNYNANSGEDSFSVQNPFSSNGQVEYKEPVSDNTRTIAQRTNLFSYFDTIPLDSSQTGYNNLPNNTDVYTNFIRENFFTPVALNLSDTVPSRFIFNKSAIRAFPSDLINHDDIKAALVKEFGEVSNVFVASDVNGNQAPIFVYFVLPGGQRKMIVNSNSQVFAPEKFVLPVNGQCPADKRLKSLAPSSSSKIINSRLEIFNNSLNSDTKVKFSKSLNNKKLYINGKNQFEYLNSKKQRVVIKQNSLGNGYQKTIYGSNGTVIASKKSKSAFLFLVENTIKIALTI
jgi:hypothetical protein